MRTFHILAAALLAASPVLAADAVHVPQPPEPALRNFSAAEKLNIVHDLMKLPAREMADNGSSDLEACRAMAETFLAGQGIQFLEPDVLTTTARPDELRTVQGQCPSVVLDETTLPKIGPVRARRNFGLYFLARPIDRMAVGVFTAERWCKESAGLRTPCPAPQTAKAFDLNSCKVFATDVMPARTVANGKTNYVQGVIEYRNEYYFANIGDVCETATKGVTGYTMDVTSIEQVNGKPKLHCSLSTPAKTRCAPASK